MSLFTMPETVRAAMLIYFICEACIFNRYEKQKVEEREKGLDGRRVEKGQKGEKEGRSYDEDG